MPPKKSPAPKSPRKQLSGAQKRKRAALKLAQQIAARDSGAGIPLTLGASSLTMPVEELPVYGVPPPKYVAAVESILTGLEAGNFNAAAQLVDGMLRDDRIYATLGVRVGGLIGARLDIEPAIDTQRARRIADDAEEVIGQILPLAEVGELLRWGLMLGVGIAQVVYDRDGKSWTPTIKVFHPKYLRFDWSVSKFKLLTADGEITVDEDDPRWIIYQPYGPRGWLRCLLRALALPWLIRSWARSWWARYAETHGQPIRLGIVPDGADPAEVRRFLSSIANIGHESAIRLMQGEEGNRFDVKLLEAVGNSTDAFSELLAHCDDSIAIAILGQSSSTSGGPDSKMNSAANPGENVRTDLKRLDAQIADVFRDQLLMQWAGYQYDAPDLAPYLRWAVDPPEDMQKKAGELLTLMQALQIAPSDLDRRAVMEEFNLPLIDEAELPDEPATPSPPPNEGDGGDHDQPNDLRKLNARVERLSEAAKRGDRYSMALSGQAKQLAARTLGPDLAKVKEAVEASSSPADLRERMKVAFAGMDSAKLADVTHKAMVLAKLAGLAAAHAEVKGRR